MMELTGPVWNLWTTLTVYLSLRRYAVYFSWTNFTYEPYPQAIYIAGWSNVAILIFLCISFIITDLTCATCNWMCF